MHLNLSKAWKVASIATSIASLFFFTIFFFYMIYGYTIYLLEPNTVIAGLEMFLCLSALIFQLKSLNINFSKYPFLLLALLQYADVISSFLASRNGGHELNPFINSYTLLFKLLIIPITLTWIQFKFYPLIKHKIIIYFTYIIILFYIIIMISNFLGAVGL